MVVSVTHSTIATFADEAGAEINKAEWNDDHVIDTTGASDGDVLTVVAGQAEWAPNSGGSIAIGSPISGGSANRVLYQDSSNNLADSANFTFDGTSLGINRALDYQTQDVNILSIGDSTGTYLRFRWASIFGSGGNEFRLDDSAGTLQPLFTGNLTCDNLYTGAVTASSTIDGTTISASVGFQGTWSGDTISVSRGGTGTGTTFTQGNIVFAGSAGVYSQDTGFYYNASTNNLLVASAQFTPVSKIHIDAGTATASQLRFTVGTTTGQTSSDGFAIGVNSGGGGEIRLYEGNTLSVYTTNTMVAQWGSGGNLTLTPSGGGGSGTNRTLSFSNGFGNVAIYLYDAGTSTRYGWGMQSNAMQFFQATATGNVYTWNNGGGLNATGTNELMRLTQYASGTGAAIGMGRAAFSPTTPYRIDIEGVSVTTGSAGVEGFFRVNRAQTGGVSYPQAFSMALGRYSSSGLGPDSRVDFLLKSTAATNFTTDATVLTMQSNLIVQTYGALCVTSQQSAGLLTALPIASFAINYTGSSTLGTFIIGEDKRASGASSGAFVGLGVNDGAAMASADRLGGVLFFGYDGTSQTRNGAGVFGFADGTWSSTSIPTYLTFETAPSGSVTRAESFRVTSDANIQVADGKNFVFNTTTGTKIGTATTQKLGFYNATPIVQGASVADATGGVVIDAEARAAINALISRIEDLGLIATV